MRKQTATRLTLITSCLLSCVSLIACSSDSDSEAGDDVGNTETAETGEAEAEAEGNEAEAEAEGNEAEAEGDGDGDG
ncbi:MAG TPA: hypothetical protein VM869_03315, partial [Enhygromyxa sp.]|nr:hypothetical protein [Enhygromyxa sp.]